MANTAKSAVKAETEGIQPHILAAAAYFFSIIGGIVVYLISKDRTVRFHALQSTILGVVLTVVVFVLSVLAGILMFVYCIGVLLWPVVFIIAALWVLADLFLAYKAYVNYEEKVRIPFIADLAEKYA